MFRHSFQHKFVTVFNSIGSKPLAIWDVHTKNGHVRRLTDEDLNSLVLELMGVNVATTYITAPCAPCPSLSIKLPFLVMLLKNMKKYFSFEVQILDDGKSLRRLRFSNYQSETRVSCFSITMPLSLVPQWNQVKLNLADFTRRAYGTNYVETVRVQLHANIRVKTIYFSDQLYGENDTPAALQLVRNSGVSRKIKMRVPIGMATGRVGKVPDEPVEAVRPPTPEVEEDHAISTEVEEAPFIPPEEDEALTQPDEEEQAEPVEATETF
ncbi:cilia- and flagella-associated protein 20-like [Anopheles aquasalis]|uniref:cilia- and flagella-associated protein 20-like n=1 Tax=Anopheles aquasalis TaxID=42839 RepID=UPI00215A36A9|nr:cilia- and flagella-associated protein 20-like [Anopheles aquasalis]